MRRRKVIKRKRDLEKEKKTLPSTKRRKVIKRNQPQKIIDIEDETLVSNPPENSISTEKNSNNLPNNKNIGISPSLSNPPRRSRRLREKRERKKQEIEKNVEKEVKGSNIRKKKIPKEIEIEIDDNYQETNASQESNKTVSSVPARRSKRIQQREEKKKKDIVIDLSQTPPAPPRRRSKRLANKKKEKEAIVLDLSDEEGPSPPPPQRRQSQPQKPQAIVLNLTSVAAPPQQGRRKRLRTAANATIDNERGDTIASRLRIASRNFNKLIEEREATHDNSDTADRVLNTSAKDGEELFFIPEYMMKILKKHQIEGLRFAWNRVVVPKNEKLKGVILAHSMGLGKTLTMISFMILFMEYVKQNRILVFAPKIVLVKWEDEVVKWCKKFGFKRPVRTFVFDEDCGTYEKRIRDLKAWRSKGGIVLINYELFISLTGFVTRRVVTKETIRRADEFQEIFGETELIVFDEGQKLKNVKTRIYGAVKKVLNSCRNRIILTGTPLQNDLREYFHTISVVRPGFFTITEWQDLFENPIKEGQGANSSEKEVQKMLGRSYVLFEYLKVFVHRKGPEVLAETLPPKEDFVVFLKLSEFQRELYQSYLDDIKDWSKVEIQQYILPICQHLAKCINHPDMWRHYLVKEGIVEFYDSAVYEEAKPIKKKKDDKKRKEEEEIEEEDEEKDDEEDEEKDYQQQTTDDDDDEDDIVFQKKEKKVISVDSSTSQSENEEEEQDNDEEEYGDESLKIIQKKQQERMRFRLSSPSSQDNAIHPPPSSIDQIESINDSDEEEIIISGTHDEKKKGDKLNALFSLFDETKKEIEEKSKNEEDDILVSEEDEQLNELLGTSIFDIAITPPPKKKKKKKHRRHHPKKESSTVPSSEKKSKKKRRKKKKHKKEEEEKEESLKENIEEEETMETWDGMNQMKISKEISKRFVVKEYKKKCRILDYDRIQQFQCFKRVLDRNYDPFSSSPEVSSKFYVSLKLIELFYQQNEKCIVFSQYTKVLDTLEDIFKNHAINIGTPRNIDMRRLEKDVDYYRIDGNVSCNARQDMIDEFNDKESNQMVFLMSINAGSFGIDLYGATRVILMDQHWNPTIMDQAIGRSWRFGQKNPVKVYRLVAGHTSEEAILKRTISKVWLHKKIIDGQNPKRVVMKEDIMGSIDYNIKDYQISDSFVRSAIEKDGYGRVIFAKDSLLKKLFVKFAESWIFDIRQYGDYFTEDKGDKMSQAEKEINKIWFENYLKNKKEYTPSENDELLMTSDGNNDYLKAEMEDEGDEDYDEMLHRVASRAAQDLQRER